MVTYRKDETQRPKGWKKGAPPHIGVWFCRTIGTEPKWRWWSGEFWSVWNNENAQPHEVERDFNRGSIFDVREIFWSFYWPENARVARVNPETGEVTGSGPCPYETDGKEWPFGEVKKKSADAPKLKKKPAGNRKVTQYVVMVGYGFPSTYPAATFALKKHAVEYIEREARSGRYETIYLDAIRFRSPEA